MSQIALTSLERLTGLQRFGYNERESSFLGLAALHSGFFLRRQYCEFIGKEVGGTAAALIEKLIARDHVTVRTGLHNTKVYHLSSRPFYEALGQPDNRNRRERPPGVMKNKLMCLDFVLDHPEQAFLATEQEKVEWFTRALALPKAMLPARQFQSPTSALPASRFFVDKYPIAVSTPPSGEPRVSLSFVDEGLATVSRFQSHLRQYAALFAGMRTFELIYVADTRQPFEPAQRVFESFLDHLGTGGGSFEDEWPLQELLAYFETRRRFELKRFEAFDRTKLIQLRNDSERFAGTRAEALYETWKNGGDAAVRDIHTSRLGRPKGVRALFSTHLLAHTYDFFSHISLAKDGAGADACDPTSGTFGDVDPV